MNLNNSKGKETRNEKQNMTRLLTLGGRISSSLKIRTGPLILPLCCLFNVTVSITDDLFASRGNIHVTEHVIPMEFLKQPSKYI